MNEVARPTLALFYCQNVPASSDEDRQVLEKECGTHLRLFPIPCGGRIEPIHLLRALEEIADTAYVITCAEDSCRHVEGSARAKKRVKRTREIVADIGLEPERVGIIVGLKDKPKGLASLAHEILDTTSALGISPIFAQDP
jgi:F420-non-reducing hydrogenase iron-sulfur subunit